MSAEQAAFLEILTQTLSSDNDLRNAAEKRYNEAKAGQPAATVASLFLVLEAADVWQPAREQGAVLLRQCLDKAKDDDSIWSQLSQATRDDVRANLLRLLQVEPQSAVRRKVADCVQSLGNQLIEIPSDQRPNNAQEWPELMPTLMRAVVDSSRCSGVRSDCLWTVKEMTASIWQILVVSADQAYQVLHGCLADPSEPVRGEAASLLCHLVDNIESREDRAPFAPLIQEFVAVLTQLAGAEDPKHLNAVLQSLQATTETCDFFKSHVASDFIPLLHTIALSHKDDAARKYAFEVIISFVESKPKLMVKAPKFIEQALEVCIHFMMELNDDTAAWAEEDEDDGEEDEEHFVFGKEAVDRICRSAHRVECFSQVLEVLKPAVAKLFQGEWKQVVAAISTLSQIAEYVDEEVIVTQMVQALMAQLSSSSIRVRYAAWGAITQFSEDHGEVIASDVWVAQLVPKFLQGLDDSCARVGLRSMEAFQHYGESIEREDLEPFVPILMEKLGVKLHASPLFQKKAITFIAVIAGQVGDSFAPYYPTLMPVLQQVVQSTLDKVEERTLLGKCFECISLLGKAVGQEGFKPDAQAFMEAMIRATQVPNLPSDDPVKEYMMAASERICSTMKQDFLPYVHHILPGVLEKLTLAPKVIGEELGDLEDLKEKEVDLTVTQENGKVKVLIMYASDKQDLQGALECVHTFAEELGRVYAAFVAQTAHALLPVFDFNMDEGIRTLAFETWGQLCKCAREDDQVQIVSELVMEFLKRILPKFDEDELDVAALRSRADGVKCCLQKAGPGILSMEQVEHISSTAMRFLGESFKRREESAKGPPGGQQEDEDGGIEDDDEGDEQNLRVALCEIAGAVMQHHPDTFVQVQKGFPAYLSLAQQLQQAGGTEDRKLSLFVVCDFLEHLKSRVTSHWPLFMPQLLQDVLHKSAELRQPACYGISLAAQDPAFSEIAVTAATQLSEVVTQSRQRAKKKSEKTAQACADNALSALVEILLNHKTAVAATEGQLWDVWLAGLPCQVDEQEGERNHKTLLRLVEQERPEVVGDSGANLPRLLSILVDVYKTDMVDEETSEGIGKLALRVGESRLEGYATQYTEKQRKKLLRIVRDARKASSTS